VAAEAEADASHLYGGYAYGAVSSLGYGGYNGVHATPAIGYSAALPYGAAYGYAGHFIGKREAEADASVAYGYAPYNPIWYAPRASSYQQIATPFSVSSVHQIHKREAEADASLAYGYAPLAYNPIWYAPRASSYQQIATPFSVSSVHQIHKREAEADASIAYGYAPLAHAYNPIWYAPRASSYQQIATPFSVSSVHQIHKREAEADASIAYGYAPLAYAGVAAHPGYGTSFEYRSPQGLHSLYRPYGHLAYAY
jgi:hypothetical protein